MFRLLKRTYRAATIEERIVLFAGIAVSVIFVAMFISERSSEFGRLLERGKVFFLLGTYSV